MGSPPLLRSSLVISLTSARARDNLSLPGMVLVVLEHLLVRLRSLDARTITGPGPGFSLAARQISLSLYSRIISFYIRFVFLAGHRW